MRRISLIFLAFLAVLLLSSFEWTHGDTSVVAASSSVNEASAPAVQSTVKMESLLRLSAMPKVLMGATNIPRRKDIRHVRKAAVDAILDVKFALRHKNLDRLEAALYDVSDPKSANYGKHWTKEQVEELVVDREAARILRESLTEAGFEIVEEKSNGEFLKVRGKVGDMERLFNTEFHEYIYEYKGPEQKKVLEERMILRAEKYHLPEMLATQVESVFDIVQAPIPIFRVGNLRADTAADIDTQATNFVTPSLINSYYSVTSNVGNSLTDQAVYGTINQTLSPSDLTKFQTVFGLPIQALNTSIGGHVDDNTCITTPDDCGEANLDVQYLMGIANTIPTTYYYTNQDWLDWIKSVNTMTNPPDVISISYSSYEEAFTSSYANSFSTQAQQLGLKGVTLLAASGDDGVAGWLARDDSSNCGYHPQFPASCPYVVAVGGTQGPEAGTAEITCSSQSGALITSGGGFSFRYTRPSYQSSVVSSYLSSLSSSGSVPVSGYNSGGRGYPDVSLLAHSYKVYIGGVSYSVDGTSASTPVFSAFLALINSQRKKIGLGTVGFVQPLLYSTYTNWLKVDINSGNNRCCAKTSSTICCSQGFTAVNGWDPVTGLGSVNYASLAASLDVSSAPTFIPTVAPTSAASTSVSTSIMVVSTIITIGLISSAIV